MTKSTFNNDVNKHFDSNRKATSNTTLVKKELGDNNSHKIFGNKNKLRPVFNKRSWMIACGYCRLSPTDDIKSWIRNELRRYAKQIGITDNDMPDVVFSEEELNAMPLEVTREIRNVAFKCYGACIIEAKTIFINVKKHSSLERLKHTIAHELVHYRFRYLKQGNSKIGYVWF